MLQANPAPGHMPGATPDHLLGISVGDAVSFGEDIIGAVGGGGGLGNCELYVQRNAQAARDLSDVQVRSAVQAIGRSAARRVVDFPPLSSFCDTDNIEIACSGGFREGPWSDAGGFEVRKLARTALRAAGIPLDSGCTKEDIEVAKIVLRRGLGQADVAPSMSQIQAAEGGGGFLDALGDLAERIIRPGDIGERAEAAFQGATAGAEGRAATQRGVDTGTMALVAVIALSVVGFFLFRMQQ